MPPPPPPSNASLPQPPSAPRPPVLHGDVLHPHAGGVRPQDGLRRLRRQRLQRVRGRAPCVVHAVDGVRRGPVPHQHAAPAPHVPELRPGLRGLGVQRGHGLRRGVPVVQEPQQPLERAVLQGPPHRHVHGRGGGAQDAGAEAGGQLQLDRGGEARQERGGERGEQGVERAEAGGEGRHQGLQGHVVVGHQERGHAFVGQGQQHQPSGAGVPEGGGGGVSSGRC